MSRNHDRSVSHKGDVPSTPPNTPDEPGYDELLAQTFAPAFAVIPGRALTDVNLLPFEFRIFAVMCGHANRADRLCWPKQATLARECGTTIPEISRAAHKLQDLGYLTIIRSGYPARNMYRIRFDEPTDSASVSQLQSCVPAQLRVASQHNSELRPSTTHMNRNIEQEHRTPYSKDLHKRHIQASAQSAAQGSGSKENRRETSERTDPPALTRDPLYIALTACLGIQPTPGTRAWSQWVAAINDLRRNGATAADIPRAILAYQSAYPRADVTLPGLAKNWPRLRKGQAHDLTQMDIHRRTQHALRTPPAGTIDPAERERERAAAQAAERELQREYQRLLDDISRGNVPDR